MPNPHPVQPRNGRRLSAGITRAGAVGLALATAVLAILVWQTLNLDAHTCEVCVEYRGKSRCRKVSGKTLEDARRGAITNACAFVSAGVTDSMACQRKPTVSEHCR